MVYLHEIGMCGECGHEIPSCQRLCRACFEKKAGKIVNEELNGILLGITLKQVWEIKNEFKI